MINVQIDFTAGTHGRYLSFVMNKLVLGDKIPQDTPFTEIGTSHNFVDNGMPFMSGHWSMPIRKDVWRCDWQPEQLGSNVIMITVEDRDIMPVTQLSFLRTSDRNCDPADLENNTYFKLVNQTLGWGPASIEELNIHYKNVDCNHAENIYSVDEWEIALLEDNKNIFRIDEHNPHCPRNILRDYFKKLMHFFLTGQMTGLRKGFNRYRTNSPLLNGKNVYWIAYQSFYNTDKFLNEIENIKQFFNLEFQQFDLENLHNQFLNKQPYKNSVSTVDTILDHITNNRPMNIPQLDVIQESYINAKIQQLYNIKLPIGPVNFPQSVTELVKQYELNK